MNFRDLLEEHNIPIAPAGHHHTTEGWLSIDCPFCGKNSQSYHMGYNINGGYVNCWKCGRHTLSETLRELLNISYPQAKKLIEKLDKYLIPEEEKETYRKHILKLPFGIVELQSIHKKYIKDRGLNPDEIEKLWGIKGLGIAGELSWRIFIPIHYKGIIVNWTTRAIGETTKRYIGASKSDEGIPKSELLYGQDYARNTIVIVEGIFDAWRIGPGTVATLGVNYSVEQFKKIVKYPKRIVCFDSDIAGRKASTKLVQELRGFPGETVEITLDSKDPAEAKQDEISEIRAML